MQTTANYGLKKPEGSDVVDVQNFNDNADTIDAELKKRALTVDIPTSLPADGGNSATATKLATARKINGASFDGSKDITILADSKFETAGGTATVITLTIPNLVDGVSKTFIASASNNSAATTINGKNLYKPNTTTAPTLIAGKAYTIWYSPSNDCFFIKASATGTVTPDKVLAGETYSTEDDTDLVGTMDLKAENIREGVTYGGVLGTLDIESLGGKKWASGITRSGDSQITCKYVMASDYNLNARALKIPITFEPSLVVAIATSIHEMTIYTNSNDGYYQKTDKLISYNGTHGGGDTANCKGDINPLGLASDGFTVPASLSGDAADYTWIAIE